MTRRSADSAPGEAFQRASAGASGSEKSTDGPLGASASWPAGAEVSSATLSDHRGQAASSGPQTPAQVSASPVVSSASARAGSAVLVPLKAMFVASPRAAQAEAERLMWLCLHPQETAKDRRLELLGPLAALLAGPLAVHDPDDHYAPVKMERKVYDQQRPAGAPSSQRLLERYRDWRAVCRSAAGLLADGRYLGVGQPWPSSMLGLSKSPPYTTEECLQSVRACALALGREPTSNVFETWVRHLRAQRAVKDRKQAKRSMAVRRSFRLPAAKSVYRHFSSWEAVTAAVALTDEELDAAYRWKLALEDPDHELKAERVAVADLMDRFATLSGEQLAAAGLTEADRRRYLRKGFSLMPLGQAALLAQVLGGSLDWMSGRVSEVGEAPSDPALRFSAERYRAARDRAGMKEQMVLVAMRWTLGELRRVQNGRDEPTLGALATMSSLLECRIGDLLG